MASDMHTLRTNLRLHGIVHVAEDVALRSINRVIFLKVFQCMKLHVPNLTFLAAPEDYRGAVLTSAQLSHHAKLPEYELTTTFVNQACAKGDQCYGMFRGETLAAYQWYSSKPTDSGWHNLIVSFSDQYIYMYKAFTHPDYRGKRLYPISVTTMLADHLAQGYKGVLCLVEVTNHASLKSCYRMGFTDCGKLYAAMLSDHAFLHADSACQTYGLRLTKGR